MGLVRSRVKSLGIVYALLSLTPSTNDSQYCTRTRARPLIFQPVFN